MTLIDLKMDLAHTNSLLERLVVAAETIARQYEPLPVVEPRMATIESLHQIDNAALRRQEDEMRRALGLTEEEWEFGGRR